jgi:hypothetical protein
VEDEEGSVQEITQPSEACEIFDTEWNTLREPTVPLSKLTVPAKRLAAAQAFLEGAAYPDCVDGQAPEEFQFRVPVEVPGFTAAEARFELVHTEEHGRFLDWGIYAPGAAEPLHPPHNECLKFEGVYRARIGRALVDVKIEAGPDRAPAKRRR